MTRTTTPESDRLAAQRQALVTRTTGLRLTGTEALSAMAEWALLRTAERMAAGQGAEAAVADTMTEMRTRSTV